MKKYLPLIILCCMSMTIPHTPIGSTCSIKNYAFQAGEYVNMVVYYNTLGIYVGAGEANFTTTLERMNGKPVYHSVGIGKTYSFFDNFFKVRDRYESYYDTASLLPYKFVRTVEEGKYKNYNNVTFNQDTKTAVSTKGVYQFTDCMQDVVSSMYYIRNFDYDKIGRAHV